MRPYEIALTAGVSAAIAAILRVWISNTEWAKRRSAARAASREASGRKAVAIGASLARVVRRLAFRRA